MFMVVIRWVSKGNNIIVSRNQLQALYTDIRHWEELIDFIDRNEGLKQLSILTSMFKCTLEQDELEEEFMGFCTNGQIVMDHIYGQISYNCCLSNAFVLKDGHNPKISLVEMKRATGKEIAKHIIRPAKVIPANPVQARCMQLLIIIHRLWKVVKWVVEDEREWRMVGKRMILVLM